METPGLPEKVEISRKETKFIGPAKLVCSASIVGKTFEFEFVLDRFEVVYYQKPNYGDDKVITEGSSEFVFRASKGRMREVKE